MIAEGALLIQRPYRISPYASNKTRECGLPDGFGAEIIRADILSEISKGTDLKSHREHVTQYILDNPNNFKIGYLPADDDLFFPDIQIDVDTEDDLIKIHSICQLLPSEKAPYWSCREIIKSYQSLYGGVKC